MTASPTYTLVVTAVNYIERTIESFGARGNGITNDNLAFEKAADFFTERGGNGKLVIEKGNYLVGRQPGMTGADALHFTGCKNLEVSFDKEARIKYADGLIFGAFDPLTRQPFIHTGEFYDYAYMAAIGIFMYFGDCEDIRVTGNGAELDGNNKKIALGGTWGDVHYQCPHDCILILGGKNFKINDLKIYNFGRDGIMHAADNVSISGVDSVYNSRQGLSWIGGEGLFIDNCKFNHTGREAFFSMPMAGIDIEPEFGPCIHAIINDSEFVNNTGVGAVASVPGSRDVIYNRCKFVGVTTWSEWSSNPGYKYNDCTFNGAKVWGWPAKNDEDAAVHTRCMFEDAAYVNERGELVEPYGNFLVDSNEATRMRFNFCQFIAHKKKLFWFGSGEGDGPVENKYQLADSILMVKKGNRPIDGSTGVMYGVAQKNVKLIYEDGVWAKEHNYITGADNTDLGGNETVYM